MCVSTTVLREQDLAQYYLYHCGVFTAPTLLFIMQPPSMASQDRSRSVSAVCGGVDLKNCPFIKNRDPNWSPEKCADVTEYSLTDLLADVEVTEKMRKNEEACGVYLQKILPGYGIKVERELQNLKGLPNLYCTGKQRPDVQVEDLSKNQICLVSEVHSSPFDDTIQKCVMSVVELNRVHRSFNSEINTYIGFAFPKLDVDQCVVKVMVTWEFPFFYTLTCLDRTEVEATVQSAVDENARKLVVCGEGCVQEREFLVKLTPTELETFHRSAVQWPSHRSLIVHVPGKRREPQKVYKFPEKLVPYFRVPPDLSCCMKFSVERIGRMLCVKYDALPHDPLSVEEARLCLLNFLELLSDKIFDYHSHGFAHQDIRLPNVCFDESYQPVLIDLDRTLENVEVVVAHGKSCMYTGSPNPIKNDWVQLGWLTAWVLDDSGDYHTRTLETLRPRIKEDPFINKLFKGMLFYS